MNDEIVLDDLEPRTVAVTRGVHRYVLRQATAGDVCKLDAHRYRNARVGEGGKVLQLDGVADGPPYLVHLCLREQLLDECGDKKERSVPLETILSWPEPQVKKLHDWVTENSGMSPAETAGFLRERVAADQRKLALLEQLANGTLAKNSPSATPAT